MRQLGVQEIDIVSIVKPITKYAVTVLDPHHIRYHLEKAVYLAQTGRPGPVWIDIPLDVQAAPIDDLRTRRRSSSRSPPRRCKMSSGRRRAGTGCEVRETDRRLESPQRPLHPSATASALPTPKTNSASSSICCASPS